MTALESTLGLGAQIRDIERIRRLLGDEPLLVIGHSFGAFIAALYAAEFPDAVEGLVLVAPADMFVMPSPDGDFLARVGATLPEATRPEYDRFLASYLDFGSLFDNDEAALARSNVILGNYILGAMNRPPLPLPGEDAPSDVGGWMVHAMYLSMGKRHDYSAALSSITARTLVVHGQRDLQPVEVSRRYVRGTRGARLLEASGADHFFEGDHAELVGAVIGIFDDGE
jgi:proline iminopeptidase